MIDKDNSGHVEIEELMVFLTDMKMIFNEDDLRQTFDEIDEDKSGSVDKEEFIKAFEKLF